MFNSLIQYRSFRSLWLSSFFYFLGVWTHTLILGWLVYDVTGSELLLAVFTAARLAPMLLGPVGGWAAEQFDRIKLLNLTLVVAFGSMVVLGVLVALDSFGFWQITVCGFLLGMTQSPAQPVRYTLVMDLVERRDLNNANALNTVAVNVTQAVGPALGGILVAALGPAAALLSAAAMYAASLVFLRRVDYVDDIADTKGSIAGVFLSVIESADIVFRSRVMAPILLVSLLTNILLWPIYQTFMPAFAASFDLGAAGLGWLLATFGAGAICGSLLLAFLGDFPAKGTAFLLGSAGFGLMLAVFAASPTLPIAFPAIFLTGFSAAFFMVLQTTLLLVAAPPEIRGRAMGLQVLAIGILPLVTPVHGLIADHYGVAALTTVAGVLAALCLLILTLRAKALRSVY